MDWFVRLSVHTTGVSLFVARLGGATAAGLEIAGGVLCCVGLIGLMPVAVRLCRRWQRARAEKAAEKAGVARALE